MKREGWCVARDKKSKAVMMVMIMMVMMRMINKKKTCLKVSTRKVLKQSTSQVGKFNRNSRQSRYFLKDTRVNWVSNSQHFAGAGCVSCLFLCYGLAFNLLLHMCKYSPIFSGKQFFYFFMHYTTCKTLKKKTKIIPKSYFMFLWQDLLQLL